MNGSDFLEVMEQEACKVEKVRENDECYVVYFEGIYDKEYRNGMFVYKNDLTVEFDGLLDGDHNGRELPNGLDDLPQEVQDVVLMKMADRFLENQEVIGM